MHSWNIYNKIQKGKQGQVGLAEQFAVALAKTKGDDKMTVNINQELLTGAS